MRFIMRAASGALILAKRPGLRSSQAGQVSRRVDSMSETVPACLVDEVHLADRRRRVASISEEMRDSPRVCRQRILQDFCAVAAGVVARDNGTSGRHADRRLAVCALKPHAFGRDFVNMGSSDLVISIASGGGRLMLVRAKEQEVSLAGLGECEKRSRSG